MKSKNLLNNVKTLAITCNQWGDTGKGKFVDIFAEWADITARGTGGDNAGHTICYDGKEHVTHIVPSSILYDNQGKFSIIGSGTVIYPKTLWSELELLTASGLSYNNLTLALNAKLILPQHIVLDRIKESDSGSGKIGTTGKGIGPAYTDYYARIGLTVNDLLNQDQFVKKLKRNLKEKVRLLKTYDPEVIKKVMEHEHLEQGIYYQPEEIFNVEAIIAKYLDYGLELKNLICDTDAFLQKRVGQSRILLEGAQGVLLSVNYGSYPFVTSSDCSIHGLADGVGLDISAVDMSLGIVKFPYMTRVGGGPFPTEMGGESSEHWCNGGKANREVESGLELQANAMNCQNEFNQGVAVRMAGNEYGATTGRPRRTGWIDLPLERHSLNISGPNVILTKLDVLNDCDKIKICDEYEYTGPNYFLGRDKILRAGDKIKTAYLQSEILEHCSPIYTTFDGWKCDLKGIENYQDLPDKLKEIIQFATKKTGMNPRIVSVGPDRAETIFL